MVLGNTKPHFTLGVKAKVELKSSIPIDAITEIRPKGFTLGVKTKKRKQFFNLPLYGLDLAPREKKIPINLGGQFSTLEPMVCNKILLF
jgi:hypothetical protein